MYTYIYTHSRSLRHLECGAIARLAPTMVDPFGFVPFFPAQYPPTITHPVSKPRPPCTSHSSEIQPEEGGAPRSFVLLQRKVGC